MEIDKKQTMEQLERLAIVLDEIMPLCALVVRNAITLLKEKDSTLGVHMNSNSITFTSTGNAKQGEDRGFILGKAMMREHIENELLKSGLLTEEIKRIINNANREIERK